MAKVRARIPMREQTPLTRIHNFQSVPYGYSEDEAVEEATRCLLCRKPSCEPACPVTISIKEMNHLIAQRKFKEAYMLVKEDNFFPACSGRVCPQEKQCEGSCILQKQGQPIAIGKLEAFIADWGRRHEVEISQSINNNQSKKIAIVGSGPAGLACAAECNKFGYDVTIFETLHKAGGVLRYGIPEFRLPKDIVDDEIKKLEESGVKIELNHTVGQNIYFSELREQYDAIFLGLGAGAPKFMGIEGEKLDDVYSANEFLIRANLMKAYKFPDWDTPIDVGKKVAVIGAGNVAMDAARTALRLGAGEVNIIYRRTRAKAPARAEEIEHALEEGIMFHELVNPVRFIGDDKGFVIVIELVKMKLVAEGGEGRLKSKPIEGSNFIMQVDTVIEALGTVPNRLFLSRTPEIETDERGVIKIDENYMTNIEGVFAGGDASSGAATVIKALGEGKKAARSIYMYLNAKEYASQ